jgi:periplasmic protein TonB
MKMDRAEQIGLGTAIAGHALLLLLLWLSIGASDLVLPKPEPITVSLVEESAPEATSTDPSEADPAPIAEIESTEPEQAAPAEQSAPEPPAPPVERVIERPVVQPPLPPVKKPIPTPIKPAAVAPKPVPKPVIKPAPPVKKTPAKPASVSKPAPATKTAPPKKSGGFGSGFEQRIGGIGKATTPAGSTTGKASGQGSSKVATAPPGKPAAEVRRSVTAALAAQIRPYLEACAPSGVDIDAMRTFITLNLSASGALSSVSFNKQTGVNESNRPQAEPLKQCALRAARQASPYRGLDPAYHDVWKSHAMQLKAN